MRDYEILFIVRPELEEEQVVEATAKVSSLIEAVGGTALKTEVWGKRRLAYEVKHLREGYFVLTDFRADTSRIPELEATLKISDTVFRHLITVKPKQNKIRPAKPAEAPTPEAEATEEPDKEPVVPAGEVQA